MPTPQQLILVREHGDVGDRGGAVGDSDRQVDQHSIWVISGVRLVQPASSHPNSAVSVVRPATSASNCDPTCDTTLARPQLSRSWDASL